MKKGICLVLSAPSGGGKTTMIRALTSRFTTLKHSISYTTRQPRSVTGDEQDYNFISREQFESMVKNDAFLEWAEVHGKMYGTARKDLTSLLDDGFDVVMDIDVQGAEQLMQSLKDAVYVFILPPSLKILEDRLRRRRSETQENLDRRIENARHELTRVSEYDYVVVNDDLDHAIDQLRSILIAEHLSTARMAVHEKVRRCLEGNE